MSVVLALAAKHWKTAAVGLLVIALGVWIETLRIERDSARTELAAAQVQVKTFAAAVEAQNVAVEGWQKAAKNAQKRSQDALAKAQESITSWTAAANALAAYKRSPQITTKYRTVKVSTNECKIAKGLAVDAWDASRVRGADAEKR